MNEVQLSAELISNLIAQEAVACGIIDKTPEGYIFRGDKNDYRITIQANRMDQRSTTRLREGYDLGYD